MTTFAHYDPVAPGEETEAFISDLLDAGVDLVTVQKLAGHANVQTTARTTAAVT